ncbi:DUF2892 domain-containing protein [Thiomonas sp. Bio17B3]|jgi:hypothetical protein|uniref:YgaP family membrane protein n=2 Tax=Thiomonas TaxID=32012 RepID=UPI00351B01A8
MYQDAARVETDQLGVLAQFNWRNTLMTVNEGTLDRALRVIVGLVLIALTLTHVIGLWGWIGVVPLVAGAVGICPLYMVLGIRTCPMRRR